jgi:hypothetical protein
MPWGTPTEQPGVGRGLALLRPAELPRAAVLRRPVRRARAAAPDDALPVADGEPGGAHAVEELAPWRWGCCTRPPGSRRRSGAPLLRTVVVAFVWQISLCFFV